MADLQAKHRTKEKLKDIVAFRHRERKNNIVSRYGITVEQYDAQLLKQNGLCAICKKPPINGSGKKLHIDHDHSTGVFRGLLCHGCNTGLGNFGENENTLINAASYLKKQNTLL